jgi:hypothetical protein
VCCRVVRQSKLGSTTLLETKTAHSFRDSPHAAYEVQIIHCYGNPQLCDLRAVTHRYITLYIIKTCVMQMK